MIKVLLVIIAVEGAFIARNTWRSARKDMGKMVNPNIFYMLWWGFGDLVNRIRPGTF